MGVGFTNALKIQPACQDHITHSQNPFPDIALYTLLGGDCVGFTNIIKGLAELPKRTILWNRDPDGLKALPEKSFVLVSLTIEVGQYSRENLKALMLNARRILREKTGKIRITLFLKDEGTYTPAELIADGKFLFTVMEKNSFHPVEMSRMTTTSRRFHFGLNQNISSSFEKYAVYEGCLLCPPSAMSERFFYAEHCQLILRNYYHFKYITTFY